MKKRAPHAVHPRVRRAGGEQGGGERRLDVAPPFGERNGRRSRGSGGGATQARRQQARPGAQRRRQPGAEGEGEEGGGRVGGGRVGRNPLSRGRGGRQHSLQGRRVCCNVGQELKH